MTKKKGLSLKLTVTGNTTQDLTDALRETLRLVSEGYQSGFDRNDTGAYSFDMTGEEVPPTDNQED